MNFFERNKIRFSFLGIIIILLFLFHPIKFAVSLNFIIISLSLIYNLNFFLKHSINEIKFNNLVAAIFITLIYLWKNNFSKIYLIDIIYVIFSHICMHLKHHTNERRCLNT